MANFRFKRRAINSRNVGRVVRRRVAPGITAKAVRGAFLRRAIPYVGAGYTAYELGRAYYRYRRRTPATVRARRIGFRVGSGHAKRNVQQQDIAVTSLNSRAQIIQALCHITQTDTNAINRRQRQLVNVRGFKFCYSFRNNTDRPLFCNIAIVARKDGSTPNATDWFRGSGTNRNADFALNLTSTEFYCLPINADKYTILYRKRFTLGANNEGLTGSSYQNGPKSYKMWMKYLPFKRQIRYEGTSSSEIDHAQPYIVMWFDRWNAPQNEAQQTAVVEVLRRTVTYFREPKS